MTSSPPGLISHSPGLLSSSYSALEAGPSAQAPPPECLKHDHISQEDQARLPHFKPHRFGFFRGRRSQRDSGQRKEIHKPSLESDNTQGEERLSNDIEVSDVPFVRLDSGVLYREGLEEDYDKDVYRWAVVYENQRGAMFFSTPYYSRLSLLPTDPPAFTLPSATKQTRRHHPTVSLSSYPLPDGDWHWVSRTWMVDMRGDGHTQYDGFEYNWFFRTKHWSPLVGFMSAGGWVRRRRWVRLMVRPAIGRPHTGTASGTATPALRGISEELLRLRHTEAGATRPPSIMPSVDSGKEEQEEEALVWTGDAEGDWERCHRALIHLDRDGRRLEVWERWLRTSAPTKDGVTRKLNVTAPPQKQWSEDSQPLPSQHAQFTSSTVDGMLAADIGAVLEPAPREHVAAVLHSHGSEILELFIFPDSRTRFIELVASAGLLSDLKSGLDPSHSMFDFYSSSQSIKNLAADADSSGDSS